MAKPSVNSNKGGNLGNDALDEICRKWNPLVEAAKDNAEKERLKEEWRKELYEKLVEIYVNLTYVPV